MIYGAATVKIGEDGYLAITSIEECDAVAISKELFVEMINSINVGISFKKLYESSYGKAHIDFD